MTPQDFSNQNLRGRSFKGQYLEGANFSRADIRGANFTNANLTGANFSDAQAGLQSHQIDNWRIKLYLLSIMAGAFLGVINFNLFPPEINIFKGNKDIFIAGLANFISLVLIIFVFQKIIHKGISYVIELTGIVYMFYLFILYIFTNFYFFANSQWVNIIIKISEIIINNSFSCVTSTLVFSIIFIVNLIFYRLKTHILLIVISSITSFLVTTFPYVLHYLFNDTFLNPQLLEISQFKYGIIYSIRNIIFDVIFIRFSNHISNLTFKESKQNKLLLSVIIDFTIKGSTTFYNANLTNADFTRAILQNTNFQKANLTRTRFYEAKKLHLASLGNSILADRNILDLLVSCNGFRKSYVGVNLKGANLVGADLTDANFKGANLSEATFKYAYLERANLTQVNAIKTNFSHSLMTGVCLENWNIDYTTNLEEIECDYVYLLEKPKPGTKDHERSPSSGEFKAGDFCKLFQEVINTVDFIFKQGIDWKCFITAFEKLQIENEDTKLAIQNIELKGDGFVVVKISVPTEINKEKIHNDFNINYNKALTAIEEKYKESLLLKDEQISDYRQNNANMLTIINQLASRPITIDVKAISESYSMSEAPKKISNYNLQNSQFSGSIVDAETVTANQIGGNITNYTTEQKQNLAEAAAEIQKLLYQFTQNKQTTDEKVTKAIHDEIKNNPTLKTRLQSALKAGGLEALKAIFNHPLFNIPAETIKGFLEAE